MKKIHLILLAFILLLFQGCILHSLYPLYTEETIITNDQIEGFWTTDGDKKNDECPEGLLFERHKDQNHYHLTLCEDGVWSRFDVHLVKIGEYTYMDFYIDRDYPREKGKENKYVYADWHLIPTHSFSRIHLSEDQLIIENFDTDWLEKLFKERKIRIKHEMVNDEVLLTASPEDLQKFVRKYANHEKAFEEGDVYSKKIVKN